ncbi:hypothetical protein Tco_0514196 [Tanacetum coccineum]
MFLFGLGTRFLNLHKDEQTIWSIRSSEFVEELELLEEKPESKICVLNWYSPSGRLPIPVVLIPGYPALSCKVSHFVAVETLHLGLVKPNSFFVRHVQLPSSILKEFLAHSQHSYVPTIKNLSL